MELKFDYHAKCEQLLWIGQRLSIRIECHFQQLSRIYIWISLRRDGDCNCSPLKWVTQTHRQAGRPKRIINHLPSNKWANKMQTITQRNELSIDSATSWRIKVHTSLNNSVERATEPDNDNSYGNDNDSDNAKQQWLAFNYKLRTVAYLFIKSTTAAVSVAVAVTMSVCSTMGWVLLLTSIKVLRVDESNDMTHSN